MGEHKILKHKIFFTFLPKIYFGTYRENILINYYIKDKIVKRKQVNDSLRHQQVTIHY